MPTAVQQLPESFDALPDSDKHQATVEILRRVLPATGDVPEAALIEAADESEAEKNGLTFDQVIGSLEKLVQGAKDG